MKRLLVAFLILAGMLTLMGCFEQSERNKIGSSMDWGDDYYWNSSSESVEPKINLWD